MPVVCIPDRPWVLLRQLRRWVVIVTAQQASEAAEAFLVARGWTNVRGARWASFWSHPQRSESHLLCEAITLELPAVVEHLGRLELRLQECEKTARSAYTASHNYTPQGT